MFVDLPKKVQKAIDTLWEFSDDAYASGRTKKELEEEGFDCKGDSARIITFVIPYKKVKR